MEWRLDKEGREYHHFEDFCKLYRSEILNLNRMLDMLSKNGMLPGNLNLNFSVSNVSSSIIERYSDKDSRVINILMPSILSFKDLQIF